MYRLIVSLFAVVSLSLTLAATAAEQAAPDGIIELKGGSVAAGVGVGWASGSLTYRGKQYPISVQGVDLGSVGITNITATGEVYNLKKLEDFDGNYTGIMGGAAVAGGGDAMMIRNQNGVEVKLWSTTQGVKLALAVGGIKMNRKQ
jgi:hypothetical protein